MFNKLKEKLKNWIEKSKEDIEETAEKIEEAMPKEETTEKVKETTPKEEIKKEKKEKKRIRKLEKNIKKFEKEIEKVKKQKIPKPPLKFEPGKHQYEPYLEKIKDTIIYEELTKARGDTSKKPLGFLDKVKSKLSYKITEQEFDKIFDDLEMLLLENNVALEVVEDIKKTLSKNLIGKEIQKQKLEKEIKQELKSVLNEILIEPDDPLDAIKEKKQSEHKPFTILFLVINGTGKTTSIAKFTKLLQKNNLSVVLAAADTFRAASIEQIQIHADKLKVPLIKQDYGADPSAIGFDAIKYAEKHKTDVVLIDTAGRMHTKTNLLSEMEKICRVTDPDLKIFVAESIAGNDATEQAKTFNEMIEIDGSILTKADIDEKGGTIISISHATHKPIFYLGTGQEYEDIQLFNKQKFIEDLGL